MLFAPFFRKLLQFYCGSRAKHSRRRREKACTQQPHKTLAKAEKWNWQWQLPLPSVLLTKSIGNQLQQLSDNELLMTLPLGNWALTSIYETKETEVGKCYPHFADSTKPGRQQKIPRHCTLLRILSPAHYLSSVCTWSHVTLICNIFLLQIGTVNAPGTESNNFSNHILLPFQRWGEKGSSE